MEFNSTLLLTLLSVFTIAFIFSMFGQGGGSIYSPLLILLGYPELIATSTSLVLNFITSVSAGYIFYRNKMIDIKMSLSFIPGICIGAFTGGALGTMIDTTVIQWLLVFFLIVVGARMICTFMEKTIDEHPPLKRSIWMYLLIAMFSFAVGLISGLLGAGGGIFIVPFMIYVCNHPTKIAAGSSHLIIAFSALSGIIGHAAFHRLNIPLIIITGIAVLIGGNLGARASLRITTAKLRTGLGILMWALALHLLTKLL